MKISPSDHSVFLLFVQIFFSPFSFIVGRDKKMKNSEEEEEETEKEKQKKKEKEKERKSQT